MKTIPVLTPDHGSDVAQLRTAVDQGLHHSLGVVVIARDRPDAGPTLETLGEALGRPRGAVLGAPGARDDQVYEVTPRGRHGVTDDRGVRITSSTYGEFLLHSDGYNAQRPPDIVVLDCVVPGTGGTSCFLSAHALAQSLTSDSRRALTEPVYPYRFGHTALLTRGDDGDWRVRVNLHEIDHMLAGASGLRQRHECALAELRTQVTLEAAEARTHLAAGNIAIIDNATCLHGRSALHEHDGDRLLRRMWIDRT